MACLMTQIWLQLTVNVDGNLGMENVGCNKYYDG
jgi:hypothetical protein